MRYAIAIGATLLAISARPATAQTPAGHDEKFVREAASGGRSEVELGKLAADRGSNPQVKSFGQRMVDDHGKAGSELAALAQSKHITAPAEMDPKARALKDRLMTLQGAAFDRAYMDAMVKDHETDVQAFQTEAQSGADPDIKRWASSTLPTLQEHLRLARDADRAVGTSAQK
jgi:putative membrane protein